MKGIRVKKLIFPAVCAALGLVLRFGSRHVRGFADAYASHMNAFWVNTLGRLFNLFPFSFAEMAIYAIILAVAVFLIVLLVRLLGRKRGTARYVGRGALFAVTLASLIFFLYEAGEDSYFFRTTFAETYGFGNGSYSTDDLEKVCMKLANLCNEYADQVERDSDGYMVASADLGRRVSANMTELGETYPMLGVWYPEPKPVFISWFMSKMDFSGMFTAPTMEANYNRDMPDYNKPFTMSHELAHLKGVLLENEANFVAYLACMQSDDADIRYGGAVSGWIYCGNELYKRDYSRWKAVASTLAPSVDADIDDNTAFWKAYRGKVAKTAQKANNSYLKQAGVSDGTQSYNRVVDLIVSYEKEKS